MTRFLFPLVLLVCSLSSPAHSLDTARWAVVFKNASDCAMVKALQSTRYLMPKTMHRFTLTEQGKLSYAHAGFSLYKVTFTDPLSFEQFVTDASSNTMARGDITVLRIP